MKQSFYVPAQPPLSPGYELTGVGTGLWSPPGQVFQEGEKAEERQQ